MHPQELEETKWRDDGSLGHVGVVHGNLVIATRQVQDREDHRAGGCGVEELDQSWARCG